MTEYYCPAPLYNEKLLLYNPEQASIGVFPQSVSTKGTIKSCNLGKMEHGATIWSTCMLADGVASAVRTWSRPPGTWVAHLATLIIDIQSFYWEMEVLHYAPPKNIFDLGVFFSFVDLASSMTSLNDWPGLVVRNGETRGEKKGKRVILVTWWKLLYKQTETKPPERNLN